MLALSRCRAARISAAIFLGFIALGSTSAFAQEATPPAAPAPMPAERPLFDGTHFGVGGSFGADAPSVVLAGNSNQILFGVGLIYNHNSNIPMTDADHANLILVGAYMLHNQFPFAMGPEVNFIPELAPIAFDQFSIRAGWAFWYAPFNIPAVVGTAVYVNFDVAKGASTVISTVTPAVRVVFGFK